MAYFLSPVLNEPQIDANGDTLAGGQIETYLAGTLTPVFTYKTESGTAHTNPIILDAAGYYPTGTQLWLLGGSQYKFIVKDSLGATLRTIDYITGINDSNSSTSEWTQYTTTAFTYLSATSFSVVGDQTNIFQVNRRVQTTNTGGTAYGTIVSSVYGAPNTVVTLVNTSGALDSGLSAVYYGFLSAVDPSVPLIETDGIADLAISTAKIQDAAVTFAKMQDISTARALGRITALSGDIEQLTSAQLTANLVDAASDTAPGKVELLTSAEYITGTDTGRVLTAATARAENVVLVTQVSLNGLQTYDFTGLPSWVKKITMTVNAVSSSGNDLIAVLIGDSGGIETTGYNGSIISVSGATPGSSNSDGGLYFITSNSSTAIHNGVITIDRHDTSNNVWAMAINMGRSDTGGGTFGSKLKALTATLDRVRISVAAGTFDAGTVAISYQ
jgi:hypothetical protein